jgi:hypothetical protein
MLFWLFIVLIVFVGVLILTRLEHAAAIGSGLAGGQINRGCMAVVGVLILLAALMLVVLFLAGQLDFLFAEPVARRI